MPEEGKQTQSEHEHEYELMPVSPLRKLEKRMEKLESSAGMDTTEFYREIVDIIRINQQIVDEMAKANDALRIELSKLPSRLEDTVSRLDELISYIKASAAEEAPSAAGQGETVKPLSDKLDQLIDATKKVYEIHHSSLEVLDDIDKKLKRPLPPPPMMKPNLSSPKPI